MAGGIFSNNTTIQIARIVSIPTVTGNGNITGLTTSSTEYAILQVSGNITVSGTFQLLDSSSTIIWQAESSTGGATTGLFQVQGIYVGPGTTHLISAKTGTVSFNITGVVFSNSP